VILIVHRQGEFEVLCIPQIRFSSDFQYQFVATHMPISYIRSRTGSIPFMFCEGVIAREPSFSSNFQKAVGIHHAASPITHKR
jgi:hypothetical protein